MRVIGQARVCYEGDGGAGGGGFWDSLKGLFGSGATQTAPNLSSMSLGELSPQQLSGLEAQGGGGGFNVPAGMDTGGGDPGASIPLTGAVPPNTLTAPQAPSVTTPAGSTALTPQGGPGSGVGPIGGPGGGAAATAAPVGIDPANPLGPGNNLPTANSEIAGARAAGQESTIQAALKGDAPAAGTSSFEKFLSDPSGKSLMNTLGNNANILVPAAGLGFQALQTKKEPEGLDAIRATAAQTGAQSALMQQYLTSGTLPAGLQAGLDQAKEAAKASIRARYANLPGQSSAMEAELNAADQNAAAAGGQLAIQLFSQGMNEAQISSQLYDAILQQSLERDRELSSAVGNFATAMAGGGPHVNLNFGSR